MLWQCATVVRDSLHFHASVPMDLLHSVLDRLRAKGQGGVDIVG